MKYSRKGGELQPTHPNVNSEVSQVPLASQARHRCTWLPPRWHWGWNCTRCTLQTSSPPPRKLGSGELVCKVHLVQFQLKYTRVHVRVHLSSQARIGELEHELRCTWSWVGEVLPLFRRTSSKVNSSGFILPVLFSCWILIGMKHYQVEVQEYICWTKLLT